MGKSKDIHLDHLEREAPNEYGTGEETSDGQHGLSYLP